MPEIFPSHKATYDELLQDFITEAMGLSFVFGSDMYLKLISRHEDYKAYLNTNKKSKVVKKFIREIRKKDGVIWASNKSPILFDALCSSHFSSLCELFNKGFFSENVLDSDSLRNAITEQLSQYKNNEEKINSLYSSLDLLDGVRTIQILRMLSLVTIDTSGINQISLGAGLATKDIFSLHALPKINRKLDELSGYYSLHFHMLREDPASIIVSDNDPQRHDFYEEINNKNNTNQFALNVDTYEALKMLPELERNNNLAPRNFIVALRIDHRMLPDIKLFFKLIYSCMDETADLVISIGSGFTLDDFQGRVEKIQEMFNYLDKLKLEPALIKLHDQGDIATQRATNKFSRWSLTTYQILHCKLKKKILAKAL